MENAVTNTKTTIKGTGIICKGNVTENFEKLPMELFDYLELGLITHREFVVFMKLCQLYNEGYGYAFPTISQLRIMTGIESKSTMDTALDNLQNVGLISKARTQRGNNVYVVFKPLERSQLYQCAPDRVKQLEKKKVKLNLQADQDKERLLQYKQNKQENEIQAATIVPKMETVNNETQEPTITTHSDEDIDTSNMSFAEFAQYMREIESKYIGD